MGYCMQHGIGHQKAFIITSREPRTGKSTFINILTALVGLGNCSKVRLDEIADKQYARAPMAHKLVNYFTDLPTYIQVKNIGIVKDLISDHEFVYEAKYMPHRKHKNILKNIFSCNGLPWVKNMDEAFARRFLIIRFDRTIENPVEDWEFKNIITDPDEMEGVANFAVRALKQMRELGGFRGASGAEVLEEWRMETDIVFKFVKKCCTVDRDAHQKQGDLYNKFIEYQDGQSDTTDIQQITFTKRLKKMGFIVKQKWELDPDGQRETKYKAYQGLKFDRIP